MKHIIVVCGVENSGKTNTLKEFFRFKGERWSRNHLIPRTIGDKTVYAVGANSPQELNKQYKEDTPTFVKEIKKRISKVLEKCEIESKGGDYVLVIPFTIYKHARRDELCKESIQEPISWMKYKVDTIYLRKEEGYKWAASVHKFMDKLVPKPQTMESQENYEKQSEKLEIIIRTLST